MSAFIVGDYHINYLVTWATSRHGSDAVSYYWGNQWRDVRHDYKRIASVLHAENVRSVNARYSQCDSPNGFQFKAIALGYVNDSPIQVIKACHCLSYQSCETSDWEETEAYAILKGIESSAVRMIDGYEDAEWCLRAPEVTA